MSIQFTADDIDFTLPHSTSISNWIEKIVSLHEGGIAEIVYIFCSDERLLEINKSSLSHDYYTDIITFPYKQGTEIESDIFISVDRVRENAKQFDTAFETELLRVIAHGLLHLTGYADKTEDEKSVMRKQEEEAIELFFKMK